MSFQFLTMGKTHPAMLSLADGAHQHFTCASSAVSVPTLLVSRKSAFLMEEPESLGTWPVRVLVIWKCFSRNSWTQDPLGVGKRKARGM